MVDKKRCRVEDKEEEGMDRISRLPDELIHHILSHLEAQVAVQLCILSKRWKCVWKTLPFLDFSNYKQQYDVALTKFVESFLSHRNHQHDISKMKLSVTNHNITTAMTYAIQHNVQNLDVSIYKAVPRATKLSAFSSNSLKELKLYLQSGFNVLSKSDCWDLPALRNLHLSKCSFKGRKSMLKESYLMCLSSSLQTLFLDGFQLPNSITFTALTNLYLKNCEVPQKFWDLPAILTLTLDNVQFLKDSSHFFPALVNLENLTLFFKTNIEDDFLIQSPQLVNLEINTSMTITISPSVKIIVLAPKIRNFISDGFFPITFGDSELENVNIKLQENVRYKDSAPSNKLKYYYRQVEQMFAGLGRARILTLDLETIKALTSVSDILVGSASPFYNLKYVKVPLRCKESCISACLKRYLLGSCPEAMIVTTVPQDDTILRSKGAFKTAQRVTLQESLAAPTNVLVDSENIPKSVSIDTVDMGVQEELLVHNSVIHGEDTGNDQVVSCRGNRDSGLWRGHEVNSEFVCLLDLIIDKYPETFKHFTAKSKLVCKMKLNTLCTSINDFTKISLAEVNTEMISEYRNAFSDLQDLGFNLSWLMCCLNYIEQLCLSKPLIPQLHAIDCQIDEAKNKLRDLQTLRDQKMQDIEKAFGSIGTKLAVGNIGDHLFSSS